MIGDELGATSLYSNAKDATIISCQCNKLITRVLVDRFRAACEPYPVVDWIDAVRSRLWSNSSSTLNCLANLKAEQSARAISIEDYGDLKVTSHHEMRSA